MLYACNWGADQVRYVGAAAACLARSTEVEDSKLAQQTGQGFLAPFAAALDSDGALSIVESTPRHRVVLRDRDGNWGVLARYGRGLRQVSYPVGIAVGVGRLYICEGHPTPRIQVRDIEGRWQALASEGYGPGQVGDPWGLAVDRFGNLYVAEGARGNNRIQKYVRHPGLQDAIAALKVLAGLAGASEEERAALDVDCSGSVDIRDVLLILRLVTGLVTGLGCGE